MRLSTKKGLLPVQGRLYVAQFGDSLYLVSQRFGVSVADLLAANDQLTDNNVLFPGEMLVIPKIKPPGEAESGEAPAVKAPAKPVSKKKRRQGRR